MVGLPTGTVTFLFTDIEGSTRLWERDAEAMRLALARHDEILTRAIETNEGFVFKTVGDAFCAAFAIAPNAVEAALVAQRALHAEPWDEESLIRVRMAIHTGRRGRSGRRLPRSSASTGLRDWSPRDMAARPCSRSRPRSW